MDTATTQLSVTDAATEAAAPPTRTVNQKQTHHLQPKPHPRRRSDWPRRRRKPKTPPTRSMPTQQTRSWEQQLAAQHRAATEALAPNTIPISYTAPSYISDKHNHPPREPKVRTQPPFPHPANHPAYKKLISRSGFHILPKTDTSTRHASPHRTTPSDILQTTPSIRSDLNKRLHKKPHGQPAETTPILPRTHETSTRHKQHQDSIAGVEDLPQRHFIQITPTYTKLLRDMAQPNQPPSHQLSHQYMEFRQQIQAQPPSPYTSHQSKLPHV